MRAPLFALGLLALALALSACVDGVTPDCSKVNCGTPTSDGSVFDAANDAVADGSNDGSSDATADGGTDAKSDGSVDAKTD